VPIRWQMQKTTKKPPYKMKTLFRLSRKPPSVLRERRKIGAPSLLRPPSFLLPMYPSTVGPPLADFSPVALSSFFPAHPPAPSSLCHFVSLLSLYCPSLPRSVVPLPRSPFTVQHPCILNECIGFLLFSPLSLLPASVSFIFSFSLTHTHACLRSSHTPAAP